MRGAVRLAVQPGVSEEVTGLAMIAAGTSLPEIATRFAAALRGRREPCLGNAIGSNIFNILGIAGSTALFAPLPFPVRFLGFDLGVLLGTTTSIALRIIANGRTGRFGGQFPAAIYVVCITARFAANSGFT